MRFKIGETYKSRSGHMSYVFVGHYNEGEDKLAVFVIPANNSTSAIPRLRFADGRVYKHKDHQDDVLLPKVWKNIFFHPDKEYYFGTGCYESRVAAVDNVDIETNKNYVDTILVDDRMDEREV